MSDQFVIDIGDREAIARLGHLLRKEIKRMRGFLYDAELGIVLRAYATRLPEPPGLGGVVRDAHGKLWVRDAAFAQRWYNPADGIRADYVDIDAVEVLAEGVPDGVDRS